MAIARDIRIEFRPESLPEVPRQRAERLVVDLGAIPLIDSRLIARLMQIVRAAHPARVCVSRACTRVRVQLGQLGLDRVLALD